MFIFFLFFFFFFFLFFIFFFFQAEDGIRDYKVTGVQTCALPIYADEFCILDLTNQHAVDDFFLRNHFDEVYQLAADMGGADYIFTGDNDLEIMTRSMQINLNVIDRSEERRVGKERRTRECRALLKKQRNGRREK